MPSTHGTHTHGPQPKRSREETAAAILDAAEAAIAAEGLHAARIERIAAGAGVSVGTLYNHFEDRSTLLTALFLSRASRLRDLLEEGRAEVEERPVAEQILGMLKIVRAHAREHGSFFKALMTEHLGPSALRPPAAARAYLGTRIDAMIAQGIASGEFREDPEGIFAEALQAMARLVLAQTLEGQASDEELAALADLFVRGVRR